MSIKADTRHTMKNPGHCPGCYEYGHPHIETAHHGHDEGAIIRRSCAVCGCRWEETLLSNKYPPRAGGVEVDITRPPQENFLEVLWEPEMGLGDGIDQRSPAGKYLIKKNPGWTRYGSIKPDTRHTMKNPGSCPGCYEDDRLLIETEHYGDEDFNEVRRFCDVCGCHWEEISPTRPTDIGISRPPQDKNIKYLLEDNDGHVDPKSPVGKYLAAKLKGRKATRSGTPRTAGTELEVAWFGGAPTGKTAGKDWWLEKGTDDDGKDYWEVWSKEDGGSLADDEMYRSKSKADSAAKKMFKKKTASNGHIMLQSHVDVRKLGKVAGKLRGVDDQSAELLGEVLDGLADAMDLTSGEAAALSRLQWVAEKGGSADISLLRNNIFKAANSLGLRLPSGMFASTGARTAGRVLKRQEKILQKYLDSGGNELWWDSLPPRVQQDLRRVKDTETLHMDVTRWLGDNNNPHLQSKWASKRGGE